MSASRVPRAPRSADDPRTSLRPSGAFRRSERFGHERHFETSPERPPRDDRARAHLGLVVSVDIAQPQAAFETDANRGSGRRARGPGADRALETDRDGGGSGVPTEAAIDVAGAHRGPRREDIQPD